RHREVVHPDLRHDDLLTGCFSDRGRLPRPATSEDDPLGPKSSPAPGRCASYLPITGRFCSRCVPDPGLNKAPTAAAMRGCEGGFGQADEAADWALCVSTSRAEMLAQG